MYYFCLPRRPSSFFGNNNPISWDSYPSLFLSLIVLMELTARINKIIYILDSKDKQIIQVWLLRDLYLSNQIFGCEIRYDLDKDNKTPFLGILLAVFGNSHVS